MKTQNLIERYMSQLDQYLSHIPSTEKAEIILELHAHIQDSLNNSDKTAEEVLANLGTPEEAARRYLEEKGLSLNMPSPHQGGKSETGKWLTIAFLGSIGLFLTFSIFVMIFFSPLVEVKEEEGKVRILGGLINVQEDMSKKSKVAKKPGHKKVQAHLEFMGEDDGKEKRVEIKIEGDEENPQVKIKVDGSMIEDMDSLDDLNVLDKELEGLKDLEKIESLSDLKQLEKLKGLKVLKKLKALKNLNIKIDDQNEIEIEHNTEDNKEN